MEFPAHAGAESLGPKGARFAEDMRCPEIMHLIWFKSEIMIDNYKSLPAFIPKQIGVAFAINESSVSISNPAVKGQKACLQIVVDPGYITLPNFDQIGLASGTK